MTDNLGLLKCALDVHSSEETCIKPGKYVINRQEKIKVGNNQAIVFEDKYFIELE